MTCWTARRGIRGPAAGSNNDPVPLLPAGTTVGEMSLRRVENRWVFSYFESSSGTIRVKVLNHPTDDLAAAPTTTVLRNTTWPSPRCSPPDGCTAGTLSQLYGGYIVPGSTLRNLHLVVSHWNTTDDSNWPYRAMQYRHNATAAACSSERRPRNGPMPVG